MNNNLVLLTPTFTALVGLVISIAGYAAVSLGSYKPRGTLPYNFLHVDGTAPRSRFRAIVSLSCANITLGTGLAYFIGQAALTGWWALLVPLGVICGYQAVAFYIEAVPFQPSEETPNLSCLLRARHPNFYIAYSLIMLVTYLTIVAFEMYTSSQIVCVIVFPARVQQYSLYIAILFLFVVLGYTVVGGQRSAILTDQYQFPFVVLFVVVLASILVLHSFGDFVSYLPPRHQAVTQTNQVAILSLFLGVFYAIATQFYDIANLSVGSNFSNRNQAVIFRFAGLIIGVVLGLFVAAGVSVRGSLSSNPFSDIFGPLSQTTTLNLFLAPAAVIGCVSILFSSIDSVLVATTQIMFENALPVLLGKTRHSQLTVGSVRIVMAILALIVCGTLIALIARFSDTVAALLTLAYALTALAPLMAGLVWLAANRRTSFMDRKWFILAYFAGALVFWATVGLFEWKDQLLKIIVTSVSLISFALAASLGIVRAR